MRGLTKFLLDISIMAPDLAQRRDLKLKVEFIKSNSGYGNDTYMLIKSRDNGSFEQCIDIRYDKDFNIDKPEIYIANWVYNYWTGDNKSWDVIACSIKACGVKVRVKHRV